MTTTQKLFLENDQIILRRENGKLAAIIHEFDTAMLKGTELKITSGNYDCFYKDVVPSREVSVNCKKIVGLMSENSISMFKTDNVTSVKFYETSDVDKKNECVEDIRKIAGFAPHIEDGCDALLISRKTPGCFSVFSSEPCNVQQFLAYIYICLKNQRENNDEVVNSVQIEFSENKNKKRKLEND